MPTTTDMNLMPYRLLADTITPEAMRIVGGWDGLLATRHSQAWTDSWSSNSANIDAVIETIPRPLLRHLDRIPRAEVDAIIRAAVRVTAAVGRPVDDPTPLLSPIHIASMAFPAIRARGDELDPPKAQVHTPASAPVAAPSPAPSQATKPSPVTAPAKATPRPAAPRQMVRVLSDYRGIAYRGEVGYVVSWPLVGTPVVDLVTGSGQTVKGVRIPRRYLVRIPHP